MLAFFITCAFLVSEDTTYWLPKDSLISDVLDLTFREKYLEARALVDEYISYFPRDPVGYLLRAAVLDYYMLDFSVDSEERQFFRDLKKAEKMAEQMMERNSNVPDSLAWAYFYRGAARAYAAVRRGRKRKILIALRDGVRALKDLKKALKYRSDIYDAYLAFGIYDYALAEIPKYFKWLFFLKKKGRRKKGLQEISLAAEKGKFMKIPAKNVLAWVLAYQGRTKEAAAIAQELLSMYPESRTFRWTLAYAYRRGGKWKKAEEVYEELFYLILRDQKDYPYDIAVVLYWCARTKFYLRKYYEASIYADVASAILRLAPSTKEKKILRKSLLKLKNRLHRKLESHDRQREVPDFLRELLEEKKKE